MNNSCPSRPGVLDVLLSESSTWGIDRGSLWPLRRWKSSPNKQSSRERHVVSTFTLLQSVKDCERRIGFRLVFLVDGHAYLKQWQRTDNVFKRLPLATE